MWFSELGNRLAYASFNDTLVPMMQMSLYGVPGNLKYQYPSVAGIHYPKVRFNIIYILNFLNIYAYDISVVYHNKKRIG